jgi:hypothetical protein
MILCVSGGAGQPFEAEVLQKLSAWEERVASAMKFINNLQVNVSRHSLSPAVPK